MMEVVVYILIILNLLSVAKQDTFDNDVNNLVAELLEYSNVNLQTELLKKESRQLNLRHPLESSGKDILENVIRSVNEKVLATNNILESLQSYMKNNYEFGRKFRPPILCCGFNENLVWAHEYRTKVNKEKICDQVGKYYELCNDGSKNDGNKNLFISEDIKQVFKGQAEKTGNENSKFMYAGFKDGTFVKYPARNNMDESLSTKTQCECQSYDPRFRPWYIETSSPKKGRDIFIMVEFSSRLSELHKLFFNVVNNLLDLVYPKDFIYFRINGEDVPVCTAEATKASPDVIQTLKDIINKRNVFLGEDAEYKSVFGDAYTLLNKTNGREKYFYFVGSGEYSESNTQDLKVFVKGQAADNNCQLKANILIIRKASGSMDVIREVLKETVACSNTEYTPEVEEFLQTGYNEDDIRNKVSALVHKSYNSVPKTNVHYALPYNDFAGLGYLLDACKQVFTAKNNDFVGVVCVSYLLDEFIGDFANLKVDKEDTYIFMFDSTGSTYFHPKLKVESKPFSLHITEIETSQLFQDLFNNISSTPSNVNGVTVLNGVNETKTYFWQNVPQSDFTIFVVTSKDYVPEIDYSKQTNTQKGNILYHRIDLVEDIDVKKKFCNMYNEPVAKDAAIFKISKDSFIEQYYHISESSTTVGVLDEYFQSTNPETVLLNNPHNNFNYPDQLKDKDEANKLYGSLVVAQNVSNRWLTDTSEHTRHTLFRYLAFNNGLIVVVPGLRLHPYYDARVRPWFVETTREPDTIHFMPPYIDRFTGITTVSMYKAFFKHSGNLTQVAGVAGVDLTPEYLKYIFMKQMKQSCDSTKRFGKCLMVNKRGVVIYHDDFTEEEKKESFNYEQEAHIVQMEPLLAEDLIKKDLMKKHICLGYNKVKPDQDIRQSYAYYSYTLDLKQSRSRIDDDTDDIEYSIIKLEGFNLFVIHLAIIKPRESDCVCNTVKINKFDKTTQNQTCVNTDEDKLKTCECPCYVFQKCNNFLGKNKNLLPVCLPIAFEDEKLPFNNTWNVEMFPGITDCIDPKCKDETIEGCKRPGCQWCTSNCNNGSSLPNNLKRCDYEGKCCPQTTQRPTNTATSNPQDGDGDDDDDAAMIALYVLIPIIIIVIIVLVVILCYKRNLLKYFHLIIPRKPHNKEVADIPGIQNEAYRNPDHEIIDNGRVANEGDLWCPS